MTDPLKVRPVSASERALGRLEATVSSIESRIERLETGTQSRMAGIEEKLDAVVHTLAQSQGAMKLAHWLAGGLLAAIGFVVSWVLRQKT